MSKGRVNNPKCQKYLNERRRIKNKEQKLAKLIEHFNKERIKEILTKKGKFPRIRRPIENIIKSCKIGRAKEGYPREDFKFKQRKGIPSVS